MPKVYLESIKAGAVGLFGKGKETKKLSKRGPDSWEVYKIVSNEIDPIMSTDYILAKYPELQEYDKINWLWEGK